MEEEKRRQLERLEKQLKELKGRLPEHCYGKEGYIGTHRASPELWQKIEDLEDKIKEVKSEPAK